MDAIFVGIQNIKHDRERELFVGNFTNCKYHYCCFFPWCDSRTIRSYLLGYMYYSIFLYVFQQCNQVIELSGVATEIYQPTGDTRPHQKNNIDETPFNYCHLVMWYTRKTLTNNVPDYKPLTITYKIYW